MKTKKERIKNDFLFVTQPRSSILQETQSGSMPPKLIKPDLVLLFLSMKTNLVNGKRQESNISKLDYYKCFSI